MSEDQRTLLNKHRGDLAVTTGDIQMAVAYYEQSLALKPSYQTPHKKLGDIYKAGRGAVEQDRCRALGHYRDGLRASTEGDRSFRILKNTIVLLRGWGFGGNEVNAMKRIREREEVRANDRDYAIDPESLHALNEYMMISEKYC